MMMRRAWFTSLLALALCGVQPPPASTEESVLTIEAQGFETAKGYAVARVYAPGDNVMGTPRWTSRSPIANGRSR
jgi:hypothetical protein